MSVSRKFAAAFLFLIFVSWAFISCRQKTETEIIATMIAKMAVQLEKKDAAGLIAHLADSYRDFEGRDRAQTAVMVEEYFSRYRGIVVKVLTSRIILQSSRQAAVETDIALYSGAAAAFQKLIGFSGENYRFQCRLHKNGRWLVSEAAWDFIQLDSLFPESLKILRALFPNL